MTTYVKVRAKGGFLVHLVPAGDANDTESLCGHDPYDPWHTTTRMGRKRAGWTRALNTLGMRECTKCFKRLKESDYAELADGE